MLENNEDRKCGCPCGNPMPIANYFSDMEAMNLPNNCPCPRDMTREEMMCEIKQLDFAINELALYLDTHPEDAKALCLHREYCKKLKDLQDKYQKVYGPLSIYYPCNKWRWLEMPWPWERGNY